MNPETISPITIDDLPRIPRARVDALLARLAPEAPPTHVAELSDAEVAARLEALAGEVDANRWRDNDAAMAAARGMLAIALARGDNRAAGLALLKVGDCQVAFGDRHRAAWESLACAGELFLQCADDIGWARSVTGRVGIGIEIDRAGEALELAETARCVLLARGASDYLVRLLNNLGVFYDHRGWYQRGLTVLNEARTIALDLGDDGRQHMGLIYNNIGNIHAFRGELRRARNAYELADEALAEQGREDGRNRIRYNIAHIDLALGRYQRSLRLLHGLLGKSDETSSFQPAYIKMHIIECYLELNKDREALELSKEVTAELLLLDQPVPNDVALNLHYQASAEAKLGLLAEAESKLARAHELFHALGAESWEHFVALLQARVALTQGRAEAALQISERSANFYGAKGHAINAVRAGILMGESLLALGRLSEVRSMAPLLVAQARAAKMPQLRYRAHLLVGRVREVQGWPRSALRHCRAAMSVVERWQSALTITLRPSFLEDKNEALHRAMRLTLTGGEPAPAFELLERAKTQVMLGYLANRQRLFWRSEGSESEALVEELTRLREEHAHLYSLATNPPGDAPGPAHDPATIRDKLTACERRLQGVVEQLYLQGARNMPYQHASAPDATTIQQALQRLDRDAVLFAYYDDGRTLWAFAIRSDTIEAVRLSDDVSSVVMLQEKLEFNIRCALAAGATSGASETFTRVARRLGQKLAQILIAPLGDLIRPGQRLIVVPYGRLHYLPFNILHDGDRYLIESHEVVTLPAAGLLTQERLVRPPGALVMAHSDSGRLPNALVEAKRVASETGGQLLHEQASSRDALTRAPQQILHVAAHGRHRLDQPDLSFVRLSDGQLFSDDLLQHDLSYELVTLSGCETGRATVKRGEELIGLGRGVLIAGAGALVASLWRVDDAQTVTLMEAFYQELSAGQSKAAALRTAQCRALVKRPDLHPAYWGAFQLVGDARPLSAIAAASE